jgi:hydrophobe/amphiphile efflux-1 (HAE1) family protein
MTMRPAEVFARRPIGTSLIALGLILLGVIAYRQLPIALLPAVDLPTLQVIAELPGASARTLATTVAAPLERQLGRIAGVTDISSFNTLGFTSVKVQFALGHDTDAAAQDVQAAINAALSELPETLPSRPILRKSNPAMAPLLNLALTADTLPVEKVFDFAESVVAQRLSQLEGVAGVTVDGAERSTIRVSVDPAVLASLGLGLADVRATIASATAPAPKGRFDGPRHAAVIGDSTPLSDVDSVRSLVITDHGTGSVRIADVAVVASGSANARGGGWFNNRRAVFATVLRQSDANLVETANRVRAELPRLERWMPPGIRMDILSDRTDTIRAAIAHVQWTLSMTTALVAIVILLFLRRVWVAVIPSAMIPVALAGTLGVMHLCGYSLDILSLTALTIAVGFVVDDAIVMIENVARHREAGYSPLQAAILGTRQIAFTIVLITAALLAAFIPLIFMPGIVGRFMQEFAVTLSAAIVISAITSLTFAPALCARFLVDTVRRPGGRLRSSPDSAPTGPLLECYAGSLRWALSHRRPILVLTMLICAATVTLYIRIPRSLLPPQDGGVISGSIDDAPDAPLIERRRHGQNVARIILSDPAVSSVGFAITTWGNWIYVNLKPLGERTESAIEVIDRLQPRLSSLPGGATYLHPVQDFWIGGRQGYAQYEYTLQGEGWDELSRWVPKVRDKLRQLPELKDVGTYQERRRLEAQLLVDRDRAARLGVSPKLIDETLYDAFGQRQVGTLYRGVDQIPIVLEISAERQDLGALSRLFFKSADGHQIPLSGIARTMLEMAPGIVARRGQVPYVTLTFNLRDGISLSQAVDRIRAAEAELRLPAGLRSTFEGNAREFQLFAGAQGVLILTALLTVYIVLGALYESYVHPLTVLSTLPPAGLGALLALLLCGLDLSMVAFIGIILLIGIVAKNAIMVIDFALDAERRMGLVPQEAILRACLLRFRPIVMTTITATLGALPLALSTGHGAELRQPLGVTVAGGLVLSQLLTLYTTPVVYLYLGRLQRRWRRRPASPLAPDSG